MPVVTLKVLASLLQLHGPGADIQSDHAGINAILGNVQDQVANEGVEQPAPTEVYFRKAGFIRGGGYYGGGGAFRRGAFRRY